MFFDKYYSLIENMVEKTNRNIIKWEQTADHKTFLASFTNYSVGLTEGVNKRGQPEYFILITDPFGETLEKIGDEALDEEKELSDNSNYRDNNYYHILSDLYTSVRRKAMGVETAIDSILNDLKS